MNKKDRIALVLTAFALLGSLLCLGNAGGLLPAVLLVTVVLSYWGYRFIKNDISFIKLGDG